MLFSFNFYSIFKWFTYHHITILEYIDFNYISTFNSEFYIFIYFCYKLISFYFNIKNSSISYKVGVMVMNTLSFCLFWKILYLFFISEVQLSQIKYSFLEMIFVLFCLFCFVFFFQHLEYIIPLFFGLHGFCVICW